MCERMSTLPNTFFFVTSLTFKTFLKISEEPWHLCKNGILQMRAWCREKVLGTIGAEVFLNHEIPENEVRLNKNTNG